MSDDKKARGRFIAGTDSGARRTRLSMLLAMAAAAEPLANFTTRVRTVVTHDPSKTTTRVKDREVKKQRKKERACRKKRRGW